MSTQYNLTYAKNFVNLALLQEKQHMGILKQTSFALAIVGSQAFAEDTSRGGIDNQTSQPPTHTCAELQKFRSAFKGVAQAGLARDDMRFIIAGSSQVLSIEEQMRDQQCKEITAAEPN